MDAANRQEVHGIAGALGKELGFEEVRSGSWFTKVVQLYLRWNRVREQPVAKDLPRHEQAKRVIRQACLKTGLTGFASGLTSTGSALLTLHTHGIGAVVGVPATVGGLLGDVLYRAVIHMDLTCTLGAIYGISFDPEDPADLLRLYSLAFEGEEEPPAGGARGLVDRVLSLASNDIGVKIGRSLLGQALRRNAIPLLGVATSPLANVRTTRRLGETVHRYVRYQRALQDAAEQLLQGEDAPGELAVEGVWFLLTADGQMKPEEAAILGWMLGRLSPLERGAVQRRFVEDEGPWMERLRAVPEQQRANLFRLLEVAAAVDRSASLPERRMLRNVARALGMEFDPRHLEVLTRELENSP
ncbi:MAG: hypothetical protein RMJ98_14525 [Myxococcales bacterium]|nr:TerB family tellurite resistance protein [Polyangiaceae bacterium]MDW8250507.1 hypothetical protein [Myxococcales bacterium]